jgi:hypothetical protein
MDDHGPTRGGDPAPRSERPDPDALARYGLPPLDAPRAHAPESPSGPPARSAPAVPNERAPRRGRAIPAAGRRGARPAARSRVLVGIGSVAALGALVAGMWSTAAGSDAQGDDAAPAVDPADGGGDLQAVPDDGWSVPDEDPQDPSGSLEGDGGAIPSAPEIQAPSGPSSGSSHAS